MFRPPMCPSSGETAVFMLHLVLVILYGWLSGMQEHMLLSGWLSGMLEDMLLCGWLSGWLSGMHEHMLLCGWLSGWLSGMQEHMLLRTARILNWRWPNLQRRRYSPRLRHNFLYSYTDYNRWFWKLASTANIRNICSCLPDSYPHRITSTMYRINTVVSPDDGHIVARNM
jgi:hypothetical protein